MLTFVGRQQDTNIQVLYKSYLELLEVSCASVCTAAKACGNAVDRAIVLEFVFEEFYAPEHSFSNCFIFCQNCFGSVPGGLS
jgi:hypothetical protein